jgi:hypothetical protein
MKDFLNVADSATALGINPRSLLGLIEHGDIRADAYVNKENCSLEDSLFKPSTLNTFLDKNCIRRRIDAVTSKIKNDIVN